MTNSQYKCSCVGGNIFSAICLYLDINNRGFEFFFLPAGVMFDWVINSSILKNLTPDKAASPYTLENFWLENDKL